MWLAALRLQFICWQTVVKNMMATGFHGYRVAGNIDFFIKIQF